MTLDLREDRAAAQHVANERAWIARELEVMRGELPRTTAQAQVVVTAVAAGAAAAVTVRPVMSVWLTGAGVAGLVALAAIAIGLWPVLSRFGPTPYPVIHGSSIVEYERAVLESRRAELDRVTQLVRRKFTCVQIGLIAAGLGVAGVIASIVA